MSSSLERFEQEMQARLSELQGGVAQAKRDVLALVAQWDEWQAFTEAHAHHFKELEDERRAKAEQLSRLTRRATRRDRDRRSLHDETDSDDEEPTLITPTAASNPEEQDQSLRESSSFSVFDDPASLPVEPQPAKPPTERPMVRTPKDRKRIVARPFWQKYHPDNAPEGQTDYYNQRVAVVSNLVNTALDEVEVMARLPFDEQIWFSEATGHVENDGERLYRLSLWAALLQEAHTLYTRRVEDMQRDELLTEFQDWKASREFRAGAPVQVFFETIRPRKEQELDELQNQIDTLMNQPLEAGDE